MIRTITRDERAVGAYWYDEDGSLSHLCDRCGTKHTMNAQDRQTLCADCRWLARWEAEAPMRGLALAMAGEGKGVREIARELGSTHATVGRWIKAAREEM